MWYVDELDHREWAAFVSASQRPSLRPLASCFLQPHASVLLSSSQPSYHQTTHYCLFLLFFLVGSFITRCSPFSRPDIVLCHIGRLRGHQTAQRLDGQQGPPSAQQHAQIYRVRLIDIVEPSLATGSTFSFLEDCEYLIH